VLAAWERGIGSNWTGFGGLEQVAEMLGIPSGMSVLAVLPFGFPAQRAGAGKKRRKPLGEVASSERFGAPFGA
jgi:nitroreductase